MLQNIPLQGPGMGFSVLPIIGLLLLIVAVVWTYQDAQANSDHPAVLWALVVLIAPLLGLILYLILGRN